MRFTRLYAPTLREDPAEAEVVSHKLLIRAGFVRRLATGVFSLLPLGVRTITKTAAIIRQEMEAAGAQEVFLPMVQPAELWKESGRWDHYGKELLRFKDRHDNEYCLGPTHEEVITDLVRKDARSWRDLPINLFQVQTKFRDEIRPRFGVMRSREFMMKDGYSFDRDEAGANASYEAMFQAYQRIFTRCGLKFSAVEADSGSIGGAFSHEFMVLAETGEDEIASCAACSYAANTEKAELKPSGPSQAQAGQPPAMERVETRNQRTIEEVSAFLKIDPRAMIKTLIYITGDGRTVAALVTGDRELNEIKLEHALGSPGVELAPPAVIEKVTGAAVGFAGPVGLEIPVLADHGVMALASAACGANETDFHLTGVVPGRDFTPSSVLDLALARAGDACPRCGGALAVMRGIEVGHVFKLGDKYSKALGAKFLDENGQEQTMVMGCYGIGVGRAMAAAIEQNHDEHGIIWPMALAPFQAVVLPLQMNSPEVAGAAEALYAELKALGVDVLLDDRDERAGVKFNDADLIGLPIRVAIGKKSLAQGQVELKMRAGSEVRLIPVDEAATIIRQLVDQALAPGREGEKP